MAELQFPSLGNALAAGSTAAYNLGRSRREAEADRMRKDAQQYIQPALKGDQDAFGKLAANAPETASSIAAMLGRMDAAQRAKAKDAAEYTANAANAILQADPASRPMIYRQMREDGIRRGFNLDSLPPEYAPGLDGMLRSQRSMAIPLLEQMKMEENRPTPLGDGPAPAAPASGGGGPRAAIANVESGGRYDVVGPVANAKGNRAYGKYQVMDFNVGPWTQEALGRAMTPQEFLASPEAQDKVFDHKFGQYTQKYGSPQAAARAWFAGEGGMNNPNAKDVLGTTVAGYEKKFTAGMPQGAAPGQPGPVAMPPPQGQPTQVASTSGSLPPFEMPGMGARPPLPGGPSSLPMPQMPAPQFQPSQIAQGDGGQTAPGGVRITPEAQLQPEVRSVREIVRATRPGYRVMITPKTGLPIYDSQGRLYIQGPNGEPDYIEIPKAEAPSPGFRSAPGGRQEFIPGSQADPEVIRAQGEARRKAESGDTGPFPGNSVGAKALNILVADGTLTLNQAAQLEAGKVITDPSTGTITFATPQGIFNRAPGAAPVAVQPAQAAPPTEQPPAASPPTSLKLPPKPPTNALAPPVLPAPQGMIPMTPGKGPKPLDNSARDDLKKTSTALEFGELLKSFKPSYGGYGVDMLGDLSNTMKRNTPEFLGGGDSTGQAQWWQRYQGVSNLERNALFGASLTAGETAAWKAATASPGMRPDQIKENLQRQSDIAFKAMSRLANSMLQSGYSQEAIEAAIGIRLKDLPDPIGGVPQATPSGGNGGRPPLEAFER